MPLTCVNTHTFMTAYGKNGPSPPVFPLYVASQLAALHTLSRVWSVVHLLTSPNKKKTWEKMGQPALISYF